MPHGLISPITGNALIGNNTRGYTDSVTGQFFTSDEIHGSINEVQTGPVELALGGGGLVGAARRGLGALARNVLKRDKKKKKKSPCATCGADKPKKSQKLGDLREDEIQKIQKVSDESGEDIYVVGSAARGERREVGSDLPLGEFGDSKVGTRSDIDYAVRSGADDAMSNAGLPNMDKSFGVRGVDYINTDSGPAIRFSPGQEPEFLPQGGGKIPVGRPGV